MIETEHIERRPELRGPARAAARIELAFVRLGSRLLRSCVGTSAFNEQTPEQCNEDTLRMMFEIQQEAYKLNILDTKTSPEMQDRIMAEYSAACSQEDKVDLLIKYPLEMKSLTLSMPDISNPNHQDEIESQHQQMRRYLGEKYHYPVRRVFRRNDKRRTIVVSEPHKGSPHVAVRNRTISYVGSPEHPIAQDEHTWTQMVLAKREYFELPNNTVIPDGVQDETTMHWLEATMDMRHPGVLVPRRAVYYAYLERHNK